MDVRLVIITSSSGTQLRDLVALSRTSLPLSCFYGDPLRQSYQAIHAHSGILPTLVLGLTRLPQYIRHIFALVSVGAMFGASRQGVRGAKAAWQQGAAALIEPTRGLRWLRLQRDPVDFGQPLIDTARAMDVATEAAMHLNYGDTIETVTQKHFPRLHAISQYGKYVLLIVILVLAGWIVWRYLASDVL